MIDTDKLNQLAAKAMGYEFTDAQLRVVKWNPVGCADDALMLLEKVAKYGFEIVAYGEGADYFVTAKSNPEPFTENVFATSHGETAPLAMTLCALRAEGVSDAEMGECK